MGDEQMKENLAATADLPLLHRLAIIYLMLPLAIWLLGWFEYWLGIPLTALIILGLWNALSGSWRVSGTPAALVLLLIALAWVMLNPAGGLFDSPHEDWHTHRAILLELSGGGWPTFVIDGEYLYDDPPLLRYYLGYYMVPGLAGKWFGPAVLNWAVPLWTWGGVALVVLLFARRLTTLRATLAAAVLIFFGGLKVLLYLLHEGGGAVAELLYRWTNTGYLPNPVRTLVFYQSIALTFHNSPQHFITGGLASLLLLQLRHPRFLAVSGIVLATCLFWSSLLSIGLLPLAAVLILKNGIRPFLTWQNLLVAPVLTGLLALYLTSGQVSNGFSFLWEAYPNDYSQMLLDVFKLYLTEFLILVFLLYWMDRRIMREPFFIASLAVLLIAPWFQFSELWIRAILPAQFVLAYYVARVVVGRLPEMTGRQPSGVETGPNPSRTRAHRRATPRRRPPGVEAGHNPSRVVFALLLGVLSVGAISGLYAYAVLESRPQALAYQRLFSPLMASLSPVAFPQKTARDIPNLLKTLLRDRVSDSDSKGELLLASKYDVYRTKNRLIYVNEHCDSHLERSLRLFLHVYPVDKGAVPYYLKQPCHWSYRGDGNCIAACQLPDNAIARIQTGQIIDDKRPVWRADIEFSADGEPVTRQVLDMTDFYLIEELIEPIYRAEYRNYVFAMYIHNSKLYYIRSRRDVTALLHQRTPAVGERFGVSLTPFGRQNTCTRQEKWQWERGSDSEDWSDISSPFGANDEYLIHTAADVGYQLRARADCIDSHGNRHTAITDISLPVTAQPPKPHSDDSPFFLHVIPVDVDNLPDTAKGRDFVNLDFRFSDHAIPYGEKLAVVRELPAYAIAGIRTGQYADGGILWGVNILDEE